jgi:disease resistance protein RPM1
LYRYKVNVATPPKSSVDPRIAALYNKTTDLVGVDEASRELIMRLTKDDDKYEQQRIVSVVGFGGLGKTTLAKVVYDKLKRQFDCTAFVPVGRNPDLKKVLKDILVDLGMRLNLDMLDERQLIDKLREFLGIKRWESSTTKSSFFDEITLFISVSYRYPVLFVFAQSFYDNTFLLLFLLTTVTSWFISTLYLLCYVIIHFFVHFQLFGLHVSCLLLFI